MAVETDDGAGSEPVEMLLERRTSQLRESELRFRDLIRRGSDGAIVLDRSGRVRFLNPEARRLLGCDGATLLGKRFAMPAVNADVLEVEISRGEGRPALVEMRIIPTEWDGQPANLALLHDVTASRSAREARVDSIVASTLARAGAELNSTLDADTILARLCRLATEILGCVSSGVYLHDHGTGDFRLAASAGHAPDLVERIAPPDGGAGAVRDLLRRLASEEVLSIPSNRSLPLVTNLARRLGVTHLDVIAVRSSDAVIGFQLVCHREPGLRGHVTRRRILAGIARIASAALDNARRVEELGKLGEARGELLAVIAHELRSSVHVILGYDELLLDGDFGSLSPAQADTARRIGRSARHLSDLIDNTLSLSRVEASALPITIREVDVADVVGEVANETTSLWEHDELQLRWHVDDGLAPLHTDPAKLRLVLRNLVGNAVKFTERGEVRIRARACGDGIEIAVSDSGPGIAPEKIDEIFEQFRQAGAQAAHGRPGLGLGLYIVRRMLEALGGTVRVESELGRGSVFRVWLPSRLRAAGVVAGAGRPSSRGKAA
jgi:signal transduction histidine kinase